MKSKLILLEGVPGSGKQLQQLTCKVFFETNVFLRFFGAKVILTIPPISKE